MWKQVLAVALCAIFVTPAWAKTASRTKITPTMLRGKIIYSTETRGITQLWAVSESSTGRRLVMSGPESMNLRYAQFSPDLRQVAFDQDTYSARRIYPREVQSDLVLYNLDGSGQRVLRRCHGDDSIGPIRFSPDGKRLLYTIWRRPPMSLGDAEVHVIELNTKRDRRVIGSLPNPSSRLEGQAWSRDGKRILLGPEPTGGEPDAQYSDGERRLQMRTCRLDGSSLQPFSDQWSSYQADSVSPDGQLRCVQPEQKPMRASDPAPDSSPLLLQNTRSKQTRRIQMPIETDLDDAVWNPSGQTFALQWSRTWARVSTEEQNTIETGTNFGISIIRRDGTLKRHLIPVADFETSLVAWLS